MPAPSEHANARGRLLLARFMATLFLFAFYQTSGLSQSLLTGLANRFAHAWWPVHFVYLSVTLLGLGALIFPLGLYEDFVLQARERDEEVEFDDWLPDALRALALDLLLGVVFFLFLCGLVELAGRLWWIAASVVYAGILLGLSMCQQMRGGAPAGVEELAAGSSREAILRAASGLGIRIDRIECRLRGEFEEGPILYVTGIGRNRRVVVSEALLRELDEAELHAYAAQELAALRSCDTIRGNVMNVGLSMLAFAAAEGLFELLARFGFAPMETPARFPLFAASLLVTTFAGLPLAHAYARHRIHQADRVAADLAGAGTLRRALEKLYRDEPETSAAPPFDLMLHASPSAGQRIARLIRLEKPT